MPRSPSRPVAAKTSDAKDAEFAFRATEIRDPDADAGFGTDDPIETEFTATITKLPERGAA